MPVPTYDSMMPLVLRLCAERTWPMRELIERLSDDLGLSEMDRTAMLPSGASTVIGSRIGWAKTYLKQAGLVEQPGRGIVGITDRGRDLLRENPSVINVPFLQRYESFRSFQTRTKVSTPNAAVATADVAAPVGIDAGANVTPEDQITAATQTMTELLRERLLARILESSPAFFERTVLDLLLAMGYGGSSTEPGEQLGRTGDGGVDGVIREDQLGLDRIYLQAKRYQPGNVVGSEAVQAFIGALLGRGSQKGVLITTSTFSKAAQAAAARVSSPRLVLLDGRALTDLMIRFNVGVRVSRAVEIKNVDLDYFEGEPIE